MKRNAMLLVTFVCAGTLAACSSPSVITTRDGSQIVTADAPDVDTDEGFVEYETDGKNAKLNTSEIRSIEEVK